MLSFEDENMMLSESYQMGVHFSYALVMLAGIGFLASVMYMTKCACDYWDKHHPNSEKQR